MSVASNSFGMLDCIDDNVLLHIPHSSTFIPNGVQYEINPIDEINLLTDWGTDKIFDIPDYNKIVFPYSRVFCDVERFVENEPMDDVGMGFYYTHTDNGKLLRNYESKELALQCYNDHHNKLNDTVDNMLNEFGLVLLVDCHSFSDKPFIRDTNQNEDRPDICIGTTQHNTDADMVNEYVSFFERKGYTVKVNSPYNGSMLPMKYVGHTQVQSIMIEVNRNLYMTDGIVNDDDVEKLNKVMTECIQPLYHK